MAKLSKKEIDSLLDKIRKKYIEYSKVHGKNKFSEEMFNERYVAALKLKADIEHFLYAEVCAIEELKKEIEDKRAEKAREIEGRRQVRKQLDDIANNNAGKIQKYPDYRFAEDAPFEIIKLYGAFILYYDQLFAGVLKALYSLNNMRISRKCDEFSKSFDSFCRKNYRGLTGKAQDFIIIMDKYGKDPKEYEKYQQLAVKDAAILLNDFHDFLRRLHKTDVLPNSGFSKENEFLKANIDFIENIINDFRISGFKKNIVSRERGYGY
jgi:hypothetical protein